MYQNNVKLNYMIFYFKLYFFITTSLLNWITYLILCNLINIYIIFSFWSLDSISLLQPLY
ncbi:hypothetical protein ACJIZ3_006120 [Penstemon smallii]|uniref:Uncharacterized protein n=1 Tax=Penstemon smallii TaxID=265156 RepID=A0ABD3S6S1_9LAMI